MGVFHASPEQGTRRELAANTDLSADEATNFKKLAALPDLQGFETPGCGASGFVHRVLLRIPEQTIDPSCNI